MLKVAEPKLTTPRARVVLDDGTEHEVRILNADMVAFDRDKARHRDWPGADTGPMFWATYLAWRAMIRGGLLEGVSLQAFESKALQVEMLADEDGADEVDPTRTGPGPG